MKLVYEDIEEGITPPEECWIGQHWLNTFTLCNYFKSNGCNCRFLRDKLWTISDDTDRLYDYSTVAFIYL